MELEWYPSKHDMQALRDQPDTVLTPSFYSALRLGKRGAVCAGHWAARQGLTPDAVRARMLRNARRWERRQRQTGMTALQGYLLRGAYEAAMWNAWREERARTEPAV